MKRVAVYPGSFDPLTLGHRDIIERALPLLDELIVLIAQSREKTSLFSLEERKKLTAASLKDLKKVKVDIGPGLTVDYLKNINATYIVRGLRSEADFTHEWVVANMNKDLYPKVETLLFFARPDMCHISSRAVKEVALHGGTLKHWVPENIDKALKTKMSR